MKNIFMFAGQGSQYYRMGRKLYATDCVFREQMDHFDRRFSEMTGKSIVSEIYSKKVNDDFDDLFYTHAAIYMFEYSMYKLAISRGIVPDALIGSSLGEFVCMAISGMIDPDEGFYKVFKQAEVIINSCKRSFLCGALCPVDFYYYNIDKMDNISIVSVNSNKHIVLGGEEKAFENLAKLLRSEGITFLKLPVKYAFHTSCIDSAKEKFINEYKGAVFRYAEIQYYSSFTCQKVKKLDVDLMWQIIRSPMDIVTLASNFSDGGYNFYDLSPGGTMVNLVKQNVDLSVNKFIALDSKFDAA